MLIDNIKRLMSINKITAKDLSQIVGVSPTHISYILNNKRHPSMDLLEKISKALGVSIEEIFENNHFEEISTSSKNILDIEKQRTINTVAAHLEDKNLTPDKLKSLNDYIDFLFKE